MAEVEVGAEATVEEGDGRSCGWEGREGEVSIHADMRPLPPCNSSGDVIYYGVSSGEKGSAVLTALLTANEKETRKWSSELTECVLTSA